MVRRKAWKRNREEKQAQHKAEKEASTPKIKKRKTESRNEDQEGSGAQKKFPNYDKPYRGLPTEIIDHILSYCSQSDLAHIALASKVLRLRGSPYLHAHFEPEVWPHVVKMNRNLQCSLTSASMDNKEVAIAAASGLQAMKIPQFDIIDNEKVIEFVKEEITENLSGIIKHAKNLKSFQWDVRGASAKSQGVWKALRDCPLQVLCMREHRLSTQPDMYDVKSSLWTLKNLTVVEVRLPWCLIHPHRDSSVRGFCQLVQRCPNLKELTFALDDRFASPFNGARSVCDELYKSDIVSQVVKLNLEGVFASNSDVVTEFLQALQKVQSLRLVHGNNYLWETPNFVDDDAGANNLSMVVKNGSSIKLPHLQELETNLSNITAILSQSRPKVIRNVRIFIDPRLDTMIHNTSCLSLSESIEELQLLIYPTSPVSLPAVRREVIVKLNQIPTSVQRLAVSFPNKQHYFSWKDQDPTLCFFQPLRRLVNLKIIVLPWLMIKDGPVSKLPDPLFDQTGPFHWATMITQKLAKLCSKLEYVYFQGFGEIDSTGDPNWKVKWGEMEDLGDRWTLKIYRKNVLSMEQEAQPSEEPTIAPAPKKQKSKKSKTCAIAKDSSTSTSTAIQKENVKFDIEVISTSCACCHCFMGKGDGSSCSSELPPI